MLIVHLIFSFFLKLFSILSAAYQLFLWYYRDITEDILFCLIYICSAVISVVDPEILHPEYRSADSPRGSALCCKKISRTARTLLQHVTEKFFLKSFKITNKFILLPSVVDPWHFGTDPDLRIRTSDFRIRFLLFTLTSVFKDKKSKRSRKKGKIKVFLTFLLVDGRIRIRTKYWRIRIQEVLTANTYVSRSTTLLLPQDRTCKQQEKPSALQREHPAFQS
jgi:hypothetical protein